VVALWASSLVALGVLSGAATRAEQEAVVPDAAEWVTVGSREYDGRRAVVVSLERSPDVTVRVQADGIVTSVDVARGDVLANGQTIASIDGVAVVVFRSGTTPFRELRFGDRGSDVLAVAQFLADTERLESGRVSDRFGNDVLRGVRALQRHIGARDDGVFRLEYISFVARDSAAVSQVLVEVGEVIAPGEGLVELRSAAVSAQVQAATDGESIVGLREAAVTLVAGDATLDLSGVPVAEAEVAEVERFLAEQTAAGRLTLQEEGGPTYTGAELRLATAEPSGAVPIGALYGGRSGSLCVFVLVDPGGIAPGDPEVDVVTLDAAPPAVGEIGTALVPPALVGSVVVRDPGRLPTLVRETCT
jgi:hypothetical protein